MKVEQHYIWLVWLKDKTKTNQGRPHLKHCGASGFLSSLAEMILDTKTSFTSKTTAFSMIDQYFFRYIFIETKVT